MTTPHVGYDPVRVRELTRRTAAAIDALAAVRSDDPAASDAIRAAKNARRNLEEAWMPLLHEIEASGALTRAAGVAVTGISARDAAAGGRAGRDASMPDAAANDARAEWAATARWLSDGRFRRATDDELLEEVARRDELVPYVRPGADRAERERWLADQQDLAAEVARRVRTDTGFADRVVAAAYRSPLTGMLAGMADFPVEVRVDLLAATLADPWWEGGWEMDKYAAAADTLMGSMLDDPARCLEVLGRDGAADALAGWPPLDQDLVADFVLTGLRDAPLADEGRLPDGYTAIGRFMAAANDSWLDGRGFGSGAALGVAGSLGVYVPTLAPGLENEHAMVVVKSHGVDGRFDLTLGDREELVDLIGAVIRTPAAQVELGVTIQAAVEHSLGDGSQVRVGDVAELAELVDEAADNEDAELAIAAATRRTSMLRVGGLIGLGVAVGTAVGGVSSARRSVASYVSSTVTDGVAGTVRADTVAGRRVRAIAYETIQVEACRRYAEQRRAGDGGDPVARALDEQVTAVAALLGDPHADPGLRQRAILNLVESVRDAGGGAYLDAILEDNRVDGLTERDPTVDL